MNRIDLYNRYGDKVYLEQEDNGDWFFKGFEHHRVLFDPEDKSIFAVDPSGGPMISIGYEVPFRNSIKVVSSFEFVKGKGYKITLVDKQDETNKI